MYGMTSITLPATVHNALQTSPVHMHAPPCMHTPIPHDACSLSTSWVLARWFVFILFFMFFGYLQAPDIGPSCSPHVGYLQAPDRGAQGAAEGATGGHRGSTGVPHARQPSCTLLPPALLHTSPLSPPAHYSPQPSCTLRCQSLSLSRFIGVPAAC